MMVNTILDS